MDTNKLISLLPDLATFVCVVEAGSFTEAAQQLTVSPSAISRKIKRLENQLGSQLLKRTTRTHSLTQTGEGVYQASINMLNAAKTVVDITNRDAKEMVGVIKISVPKAFAKQVLEPHLLQFSLQHPNIQLHINVTDRQCDPIQDGLDLVFTITNTPQENLVAKPLSHVSSTLCATPEYLSLHEFPTQPSHLSSHQCLFLSENKLDNIWHFRQGDERISVTVNGPYAINHSEMRLNATLKHLGISLLPSYVSDSAVEAGKLVKLLPDWSIEGPYQGHVYMQYVRSNHIPQKVRTFIDYMVDVFNPDSLHLLL